MGRERTMKLRRGFFWGWGGEVYGTGGALSGWKVSMGQVGERAMGLGG